MQVCSSGSEWLWLDMLMCVRHACCAQGMIQHATINNLAFGRNVTETLRILQAIQYVQENPDEVLSFGPHPAHRWPVELRWKQHAVRP